MDVFVQAHQHTGAVRGAPAIGDGTGIVSHAGVALLRALADKTGLTHCETCRP